MVLGDGSMVDGNSCRGFMMLTFLYFLILTSHFSFSFLLLSRRLACHAVVSRRLVGADGYFQLITDHRSQLPSRLGTWRMERMRMRDIEGKAAREAASECGQRASFNLYVLPSSFNLSRCDSLYVLGVPC